jgi:glycosyltransferase involved in cell wall biosynthesis
MIRVLHITFDMTIGGAQQVIRQLIENVAEDEVESEIVCLDGELGELGELLRQQRFEIHILWRRPGIDMKLIGQLHRLIRSRRYDIVHCHQYTPYFYGVLSAFFTRSKIIFTEHGRFYPDYSSWKRKILNPILGLFTSKITSISKATKTALIEYENFSAKDIELIYNGIADMSGIEVDANQLKRHFKIESSKMIFGTISRLQPIKNQSMMIRAFKRVYECDKNTHLLLVGDGEIRPELELLVAELGISGAVSFTGFQTNPYRFHKIIDVFLLSSFSEGTSMTLLESMSFSPACVVTDVGGNPELIIDGENGLVVASDDERAFAEACLKLLKDRSLLEAMGDKGRQRYLSLFHVNLMVARFVDIYAELTLGAHLRK